jgi:hypothetical protein
MAKLKEIKTKATEASVKDFLDSVESEQKRKDSKVILKMMQKATGKKPKMWGPTIVGFGKRIYKSPKTDREVECFNIGFSPRKSSLTLYILDNNTFGDLKNLGKHKNGKSCLYINKLEDVDMNVLGRMIEKAAKY